MYSSSIEYGGSPFAQWLKNIAQVHTAEFGTRVLYTGVNPGTFDTHANQHIHPAQAVGRCNHRHRRFLPGPGRTQRQ